MDEAGSDGRLHYAFIAGLSAASASFFGKLISIDESRILFTDTVLDKVI